MAAADTSALAEASVRSTVLATYALTGSDVLLPGILLLSAANELPVVIEVSEPYTQSQVVDPDGFDWEYRRITQGPSTGIREGPRIRTLLTGRCSRNEQAGRTQCCWDNVNTLYTRYVLTPSFSGVNT